jgi:hypothetical protein
MLTPHQRRNRRQGRPMMSPVHARTSCISARVNRTAFSSTMENLFLDEQGRLWAAPVPAGPLQPRPGVVGFNDGGAFILHPDGGTSNVYILKRRYVRRVHMAPL